MKIISLLTCFFLLLIPQIGLSRVTRYEHTIVTPKTGGSSWGTDDILTKTLELQDDALPWIFKISLTRPLPYSVKIINTDVHEKNFFINDTVNLYREINLCYDSKIQISKGFHTALSLFQEHLFSGTDAFVKMNFKLMPFNLTTFTNTDSTNCDILLFFGNKNEYPFKAFPQLPSTEKTPLPQLVLGLFYQFSKNTIPIIALHPDLELDFDSLDIPYLELTPEKKIKTDGKILLIHELAHVLGLDHVSSSGSRSQLVTPTVMGLNNLREFNAYFDIRYFEKGEIWKSWQLRQTSIYRHVFWRMHKESNFSEKEIAIKNHEAAGSACLMPGEKINLRFFPIDLLETQDIHSSIISLPNTIDLNHSQISTKENDTVIQVSDQIWIKVLEHSTSEEQPFFSPIQMKNYNYAKTGEFSELIFQASLNGYIHNQARGYFSLNGFIKTTHYSPTYIPQIKFWITTDPSTCFQDN